MTKSIKVFKVLNLLFIAFIMLFLISCSGEGKSQGYDGRTFDISLKHDKSLIATSKKVNNDYTLTISGTGESMDYEKKDLVPWNAISKRIISLDIKDGIKKIGKYLFYSLSLTEITLPKTVTEVKEFAFADCARLYSYGNNVNNSSKASVYYYSENKPTGAGNYFRLVDGKIMIWQTYSFLFLGNSFTFRQGSEDNPMIPRLFKNLAECMGLNVNVDYVVRSSYTLAKYASKEDELGSKVEEKLQNNQYDFIILQEQSTTPINSYNSFFNAVGKLKEKIEKYQNNASIYLYETWGSIAGLEGTKYKTIREMEEAIKTAYDNCAKEYKLKVTYVGSAFTYAYENFKDINLYADDNRHQSNVGAYLSACCHLASMIDIDVRNASYLGDLDDATAKTLREVAYSIISSK